MQVARVAVPVPLAGTFDYLPVPGDILPPPGSRVLVPFGRRRLVGVVMAHGEASTAPAALKPVIEILDKMLLHPDHLDLLAWCARYYCHPVGEVVAMALPVALRRARPFQAVADEWFARTGSGLPRLDRAPVQQAICRLLDAGPLPRSAINSAVSNSAGALHRLLEKGLIHAVEPPPPAALPGPSLNPEQRHAVAAVLAARRHYQAFLLAGVTGSGKTEVYLRAARRLLRGGRQVLLLLPEIGLTPQLVRRVEGRLGRRAWLYHSGLSESERLATWQAAGDGRARLLVGTRSAVFLPLRRPGLIVVDEEHDGAYKQQEGARYSGRDLAVMRARRTGIPVVLGSATPSLESLHNARGGRYRLLTLSRRAGTALMPSWRRLDLREQPGDEAGLGPVLLERIRYHLQQGGQVLLFRNRRGYAPVLLCNACTWQADCPRCDAHLTVHQAKSRLVCHHCGWQQRLPHACPECGSPHIRGLGAGTERLEAALQKYFPEVAVIRVDRDRMRARDSMADLLATLADGAPCILVGTQMLAKGHHLPGVTLAAVIDADQALFSADYRAPEQLGQTIVQVAGRAGRGRQGGEFIMQTLFPTHPLLDLLQRGDYLAFADTLLEERREAGLPPWRPLALLRAEAKHNGVIADFLKQALAACPAPEQLELAGPMPAVMARRAGVFRQQIWIQAESRPRLAAVLPGWLAALQAISTPRGLRWHFDVDPQSL